MQNSTVLLPIPLTTIQVRLAVMYLHTLQDNFC